MPCISIVVPTYNRVDSLRRSIDSVLNQSFDDFELIIVDDGSSDKTLDLIKSYDDDRIIPVQHEKNRGANAARNTGVNIAKGEYISFLDSDDVFHENHLKRVLATLKDCSNQCIGAFTGFVKIADGGIVDVSHADDDEVTREFVVDGNSIGSLSCVTFHSSVFQSVGLFDVELESAQDIDFYLRVLEEYSMVGVDDVLVTKYERGDNIGASLERKLQGIERLRTKHGNVLSAKCLSNQDRVLGRLYAESGEMKMSRKFLKRSINHTWTNAIAIFMYFLTFSGTELFTKVINASRKIRVLAARKNYEIYKW